MTRIHGYDRMVVIFPQTGDSVQNKCKHGLYGQCGEVDIYITNLEQGHTKIRSTPSLAERPTYEEYKHPAKRTILSDFSKTETHSKTVQK